MPTHEVNTVKLAALVVTDQAKQLLGELTALKNCNLDQAAIFDCPTEVDCLLQQSFWQNLQFHNADAVLIELRGDELATLTEHADSYHGNSQGGLWPQTQAAVIAVIPNASTADILYAARLDFDGIITLPSKQKELPRIIARAVKHYRTRLNRFQRYDKMRMLCRTINHKRRHLRDKVDLLCQHLVEANTDLTNTLHELRRAYGFQSDLVGEFDLNCMLYKALRKIKENTPEASAAVYILRDDGFAAHLAGAWYDQPGALDELEELLKPTLVSKVMSTNKCVLVDDASTWHDVKAKHRKALAGLTLMGLPVVLDSKTIGVVVLYRNSNLAFTQTEQRAVQTLIAPLGRAVQALHKLEPYLV